MSVNIKNHELLYQTSMCKRLYISEQVCPEYIRIVWTKNNRQGVFIFWDVYICMSLNVMIVWTR